MTCAHLSPGTGTTDLGPILWSPQKHSKSLIPVFRWASKVPEKFNVLLRVINMLMTGWDSSQ